MGHGLWFVRGDLMRDSLALSKVETLPWDGVLAEDILCRGGAPCLSRERVSDL
jgi:hypothetical protein